jgi:hypothetical protein
MRKIHFTLALLCCACSLFAQKPYFQQQVNYKINAELNTANKAIRGNLALTYLNQSPDTLSFIWFHIWPNAYSGDNTALAKQLEKDKDLKKQIKKSEKGFMDSLSFSSKGKTLSVAPHPDHADIIKVLLPQSLLPGQSIDIETPFYNKLPGYYSRSGENEGQYIATQWYPKPAVYDRDGWHEMPYLDMGEYYAEFGNFEVNITLPANMVVGATGMLKNEEEVTLYQRTGKANEPGTAKVTLPFLKETTGQKTLKYTAENVHDFAWFAQPGFAVQYDTCKLASGKIIDVYAYYRPESRNYWVKSIDHLKAGVRFYGDIFGEYPHPQVTAVEGPKNVNSGGMEYPMITLITVGKKDIEDQLDFTIVHEVGHNWLQGILGTNERAYPWFDEGLNTFFQFKYEAQKGKNSVMGKRIPDEVKKLPPNEFFNIIMQTMAGIPYTYAVNTSSADFDTKESYGLTAYLKAAIWVYILQSRMGQDAFDKGIKAYYEAWKFKHPSPKDFQQIMEATAGYPLDNIFDLLNKSGKFID